VLGRVFVALAVVLALEGCHSDPTVGSLDGAKLFEHWCAPCHGATGKPDAAMVARIGVKDLTAPELRMRISPELVTKQVREGSQNKLMPAFEGALKPGQIDELAKFVSSPQFLGQK
jgi:mono/diheme cytochrome c family protein